MPKLQKLDLSWCK
jgi:Leucine-rich repeat (LRR) protein